MSHGNRFRYEMSETRQKMDYHKFRAENVGNRLAFVEGAIIVMMGILFSNIGLKYFGGSPEWLVVTIGAGLGGLIGATIPKRFLKSYHEWMNVRYLRKYLEMENRLTGVSNDNAE